jgi:hypothetical protein
MISGEWARECRHPRKHSPPGKLRHGAAVEPVYAVVATGLCVRDILQWPIPLRLNQR